MKPNEYYIGVSEFISVIVPGFLVTIAAALTGEIAQCQFAAAKQPQAMLIGQGNIAGFSLFEHVIYS